MKYFFALLITVALSIAGSAAFAQSVNVMTNIIPPVSPFLTQLAEAGKVNVLLNNTTGNTLRIKLSAKIERVAPQSFTISLNPAYQPLQPIVLAPGQSLLLTRSLLEQAFGNFRESNLSLNNVSLNDLKSGVNYKLPEGQYSVCFTAYDFDAPGYNNPLSLPGTGCSFFNMCYKVSAPQLLSPVNALSLSSTTTLTKINVAELVPFSWSQPAATCGLAVTGLTYDFEIFPLFDGQIPTDAINNPFVYRKIGLLSPNFPFQTTLNQYVLEKGKKYVVRVRAINNNLSSGIEIENSGFSQPIAFQYGDAGTAPVIPVTTVVSSSNACENVPPVTNTIALGTDVDLRNQEVTIGGFKMKITDINLAGNSYSGKGHIYWKPLVNTIQLAVEFSNLKINNKKEVFDGTVKTVTTPTKPTWENLQVVNSTTGMVAAISNSTAKEINDFLNNNSATKYISKITGDRPIDFPIGLDREVEGTKVVLALMGITFNPKGTSMTTLFNMNIPDANGWLSLAGSNFCIKPDGFSFDKGSMYLPEDKIIELGSGDKKYQFTFKASANGPADSTKGTYLNWGKNGIDLIVANAEMNFARSLIVPENAEGKTTAGIVTAKLKFNFLKWQDWVASVELPNFQMADLKDFGIKAATIYYDHSTFRNPPSITFPDKFAGITDASFEGLWIKDLQVSLPPDFKTFNESSTRTSFKANNLIIDANGVSTSITGSNAIDISTGNLGGWSFSLDKIYILMVSNTFSQGTIDGKFRLPISNNHLIYSGILMNSAPVETGITEGMHYVLNIKPPSTGYTVDLWQASIKLDPTTAISISRDKFGAGVKAQLQGFASLDIKKEKGGIALLLPDLEFQRLSISNRETVMLSGTKEVKDNFYFEHGTWKFSSPPKEAAGMPLMIDKLEPIYSLTGATTSSAKANIGLKFDVNLILGFGDKSVVSATTSLKVTGDLTFSTNKAPSLSFNKIGLQKITITGDVGPVKVLGSLEFYESHTTYGDGIKGQVTATFPLVKLEATAQFGSKNGFNYWFIDACGAIKPPVPVGGAFAIAGFGGGAYHNMTMNVAGLPKAEDIEARGAANTAKLASNKAGETVSGVTFTPSLGSSGIRAALLFSMAPGPDAFNAKITLTTEIQNGGISQLDLQGEGFAITNFPSNSTARVKGLIRMNYNFVKSEFSLGGNLDANLGSANLKVPLNIYGGEGWYFKLGDPQAERISLTLVDVGNENSAYRAFLRATAYFNTGGGKAFNVILPDLPPEILKYGSFPRDPIIAGMLEEFSNKPGSGFMFGARVDGDFRARFLIFYASLKMIIGLDMAFKKFTNDFNCNGVAAGYEGWYGLGQMYGYISGNAGVHVDVWFYEGDVSLCSVTAGAVLQAGFPNPIWALGSVFISGEVLGGALSFSTNFMVSIGEKCYPTPDPLGDIKIISQVGPQKTNPKAEIYDIPFAVTNIALNSDFDIKVLPTNAKPEGETRTYRFSISSFTITNNRTGQLLDGTSIIINQQGTYVQLLKNLAFDPKTTYSGKVVAIAKQYNTQTHTWVDPWNDKEQKFKPVEEVVNFSFATGDAPDYIPASQIEYTYPIDKQRFVLKEEIKTGYLNIKQWSRHLFENKSYHTYFINKNNDTIKSTFTPNESSKKIEFPLPSSLKNRTSYRLEFWTDDQATLQRSGIGQTLSSGQINAMSKPEFSKVSTSTRTTTNATFGLTRKENFGTLVQMKKRAPIFNMFFGTSEYNSFQQKISSFEGFTSTISGKNVTLNSKSGNEKFEQFDIHGFKNASGKEYAPLVTTFIKWDESKENDRFAATNIYANTMKFRSMGINVDLGSSSNRLFNLLPIFTLSQSSAYAKPLNNSEIPWPANAKSSDEFSLFKYAQTSFTPSVAMQSNLLQQSGPNSIGTANFYTSSLLWKREKFMNEDFLLLKNAAKRIIELTNQYKTKFSSVMLFGNPEFVLATNTQGGVIRASLRTIHDIYKNSASSGLIQRLSTLTYVPFSKNGSNRNVTFQFITPVKKSAEINVPFKQ